MVIFPKAKINLGLSVTGKRRDGYHDIETVFYPLRFCDALEMVINKPGSGKDQLYVTGLKISCRPEENLVLRAVKELRGKYSVPYLKIHLHKMIPAGAGLGGGSSDAASILNIINRFYGYPLSIDELKAIAFSLGSDCPFFVESKPAFAKGRGEILEQVGNVLDGYSIVILNPGFMISTREAYQNCRPAKQSLNLPETIKKPVAEWKGVIVNDFEKTVIPKYPVVGELKESLYHAGALFSLMSGSGSSVFGIFSGEPTLPDDIMSFVIYQGAL